jgi:hypothetical protein
MDVGARPTGPHARAVSSAAVGRPLAAFLALAVAASAEVLWGCGGGGSGGGGGGGGGAGDGPPLGVVAPAFALDDVNPSSASYGASVAPADHAGSASAWYFAHAT